MQRIYLVRHGENPANLTKEFSHRKVDYPLTARGVLQARQTADFFASQSVGAVYSSPLKRAVETAQQIAGRLGLPVTVVEAFREVNVGDLEGQVPTDELWQIHNRIIAAWLQGDAAVCFPGGEDYHSLLKRMRSGLEQVHQAARPGAQVIVGHGGIFGLTIKDLVPDLDIKHLWQVPNHNCSISELRVSLNGTATYRLVSWASLGHLHGAAADFVYAYPRAGEVLASISPRSE